MAGKGRGGVSAKGTQGLCRSVISLQTPFLQWFCSFSLFFSPLSLPLPPFCPLLLGYFWNLLFVFVVVLFHHNMATVFVILIGFPWASWMWLSLIISLHIAFFLVVKLSSEILTSHMPGSLPLPCRRHSHVQDFCLFCATF